MSDPMKTHGMFSWNELMTTDLASAKEFYNEVFGWTFEESPSAQEGEPYVVAKVGDAMVCGMFNKPAALPAEIPPHWNGYVTVEDIDATVAKVKELGGNILLEAMEIPGVGRMAVISDKQGAVINIITYSAECC